MAIATGNSSTWQDALCSGNLIWSNPIVGLGCPRLDAIFLTESYVTLATPTYTKLSPKKRHWFQYSQLWLAEDHLLMLQSSRFTEEYTRYRLEDIEAIVVTQLEPDPMRQLTLGLLTISAFICALTIPDSSYLKAFLAIPTGLLLVSVIVDALRGPKCRCLLRTAVSEHLLKPIMRVSTANRVVTELHRVITATQGSLDSVSGGTAEAQQASYQPPTANKLSKWIGYLLFGCFLLNAVLQLASLKWTNTQLSTISLNVFLAEVIFAILAYQRRPLFGYLNPFYSTWLPVFFVLLGIETVIVMGYFGYYLKLLADGPNSKALLETVRKWPYFMESTVFSVVWRLPAAILTLIHLRSGDPEDG